jgi:hypothetical protein
MVYKAVNDSQCIWSADHIPIKLLTGLHQRQTKSCVAAKKFCSYIFLAHVKLWPYDFTFSICCLITSECTMSLSFPYFTVEKNVTNGLWHHTQTDRVNINRRKKKESKFCAKFTRQKRSKTSHSHKQTWI